MASESNSASVKPRPASAAAFDRAVDRAIKLALEQGLLKETKPNIFQITEKGLRRLAEEKSKEKGGQGGQPNDNHHPE